MGIFCIGVNLHPFADGDGFQKKIIVRKYFMNQNFQKKKKFRKYIRDLYS